MLGGGGGEPIIGPVVAAAPAALTPGVPVGLLIAGGAGILCDNVGIGGMGWIRPPASMPYSAF